MSRQKGKSKKRLRAWHHTGKEDRLWLAATGASGKRIQIRRPKIARRYR